MKIFKNKTQEWKESFASTSEHVGIGIMFVAVYLATIFLSAEIGKEIGKKKAETEPPIIVETINGPQIDTLVRYFFDGSKDTSYVYTFWDVVVE